MKSLRSWVEIGLCHIRIQKEEYYEHRMYEGGAKGHVLFHEDITVAALY